MFDTNTLITLIVFGLAVARLTSLLHEEEGAFGMFQTIRDWAGVRVEPTVGKNPLTGQPMATSQTVADSMPGKILSCYLCCSVWVSMLPAGYMVMMSQSQSVPERFGLWMVYTLALSALAITWRRQF